MATGDHADIAEAVKDSLNGASLSQQIVATRQYIATTSRTDKGLQVFVLASAETVEPTHSREPTSRHDYSVQVGLQVPVDVENDDFGTEDIDNILLLLEDIKDHLRDNGTMASATLVGIDHSPIYDQEHLIQKHELRSAVTFIYRIHRNNN